MKNGLMWSFNKIEEGLSELEEHDCQVERCSKITRTIMNTLTPYYDLLKEKRQAVKQLKLDIFEKQARKN
jgi:hypothetical protein